MTSAMPYHEYHRKFSDGARIDITIWKLPESTPERPHGFKYRLNYCSPDGTSLVRYDNEKGKADHKHVKGKEFPYTFTTVRQLFSDFISDVLKNGGKL